jgi:hypothetical protein
MAPRPEIGGSGRRLHGEEHRRGDIDARAGIPRENDVTERAHPRYRDIHFPSGQFRAILAPGWQ